jgi:hypothetical protein
VPSCRETPPEQSRPPNAEHDDSRRAPSNVPPPEGPQIYRQRLEGDPPRRRSTVGAGGDAAYTKATADADGDAAYAKAAAGTL